MPWVLDTSHRPPRGRLPMAFFARVVAAPEALGGRAVPVPASAVDAPQLPSLASNATAVLVFVASSTTPVLPHELLPRGSNESESEQLYWRLTSTDSCEALHTGVLLTLRALVRLRQLHVCDGHGSPIVAFGMVNARRVDPFTRHIMVPRAGCKVDPPARTADDVKATTSRSCPRVRFAEAPREAAHGGAMHQLVWCCTATGREYVMDFTGPQYGIDDRLPTTGTPFWIEELPKHTGHSVHVRGFEITGGIAPFSEPQLPADVLHNQMHSYIGSWIRDSALAVLDTI